MPRQFKKGDVVRYGCPREQLCDDFLNAFGTGPFIIKGYSGRTDYTCTTMDGRSMPHSNPGWKWWTHRYEDLVKDEFLSAVNAAKLKEKSHDRKDQKRRIAGHH